MISDLSALGWQTSEGWGRGQSGFTAKSGSILHFIGGWGMTCEPNYNGLYCEEYSSSMLISVYDERFHRNWNEVLRPKWN